MDYWLVKSEPGAWSWDDHVRAGVAEWDGVRNHQASNNLKAMKVGDKALFYHSVNEKQIVGVLEVVKEYYPDPTDPSGRFGMVDFRAVAPVETPVTLADV
jgi:predicted RNA-binding protein with PUA-like domain